MVKFALFVFVFVFGSFLRHADAQCRCAPEKFCNTQWQAIVKITDSHMNAENRLRMDHKYEVSRYLSEKHIPKSGIFATPVSLAACGMRLEAGTEYLMGGPIDETIPASGNNISPQKILKFCQSYASPLANTDLIMNRSMTLKELCPQ